MAFFYAKKLLVSLPFLAGELSHIKGRQLLLNSAPYWPTVWLFIVAAAAAAAELLQSCPTLCDPIDGLLPGSSVPGILQARTLEWAAISFSNA